MVRTGSHAYIEYDFEEDGSNNRTYSLNATPNKKFGLQDRVTSLTLTNNRINLPQLNNNYLDSYAYGQQQGSASIGFTLSNGWVFGTVLGRPTTTGSSNPYTHTYGATAEQKVPRTISIEVGVDGASADIKRTLKGGLVNTLGLSTSVGGIAECTADIVYGKETDPSTSLGSAPTAPTTEFPYTFAHAELTVGDSVLAQVQDVSLNISQNSELLYGLSSHQAVDSFKRVVEITGSFRASFINSNLLTEVLKQIKEGGGSSEYRETVGKLGQDNASAPTIEFKLTFTKNANESIIITGTGLAPTDHNITGLEPVEPIFEEINWQMKTISVAVKNSESAEE